jgi:2-polyprenyl-3-methyl-5-hydroxy-6-metoxy-1,4-benzoquinol methylase
MDPNYNIHDKLYKVAREKGWNGWGGDNRLKKGEVMLKRIFSNENSPTSGKALELGCGEGNISRLLYKKGFKVTGIDISQTAIDWAKEKAKKLSYPIIFKQADLTKAGVLGNDKYNLIVDGNCLHCIIGKDRKTFLQNILSVMKSNSVFFVKGF